MPAGVSALGSLDKVDFTCLSRPVPTFEITSLA